MFFLGNKIDEKTTLRDLKEKQNVRAYFWGGVDHQNDDNIPMAQIDSVYNKELK